MAHSLQAKKRARQNIALNAHKSAQRSQLRTAIKRVHKIIGSKDTAQVEDAKANYAKLVKLADKLQLKKVVHKNKIARIKSRMNRDLKIYNQKESTSTSS